MLSPNTMVYHVAMQILKPGFDLERFFAALERAKTRALLLDYDGTLAPFRIERDQATPYPVVRELLVGPEPGPDAAAPVAAGAAPVAAAPASDADVAALITFGGSAADISAEEIDQMIQFAPPPGVAASAAPDVAVTAAPAVSTSPSGAAPAVVAATPASSAGGDIPSEMNAPIEVEAEVDALPGVVESAVIGLPHPDFGEAVTAVAVRKAGAQIDESAARETLQRRLANFKVPKRVLFVDDLPRNTMGKVQKNVLRETYRSLYSNPSSQREQTK